MNKFQRLATQIAKDDSKKEFNINRKTFNLKKTKSLVLAGFKKQNRTYDDAKRFRNWNKNLKI